LSLILQSIVHPTDFSDLSNKAFVHALRIALAAKCRLRLLHVAENDRDYHEIALPRLQRILTQWELMEESDLPSAIAAKLGINVENIRLEKQDPAGGIIEFIDREGADLVVLATHGRDGIERWFKGSIAETVFSHTAISTLFVPPSARGFVSQINGSFRLRHALLPVDHSPAPQRAIATAQQFARLLTGTDFSMDLLHVGPSTSNLDSSAEVSAGSLPVMVRSGNVVQTIIDVAVELDADLICMATAGRHGVFDALRGSTTERVLRQAPCPLLAVPAGSNCEGSRPH
jgi:nucleotide-binding universal stress UspA family protein